MNLYAIKDTMIDYYMSPFAAHDDREVLAAIATQINNGGLDAINQTPQHFQIWKIGEVDDEGHIHAHKELLAECSSLIRPRRDRPTDQGGLQTGREPPKNEQGSPTSPETDKGVPRTPLYLGGATGAPQRVKARGAQGEGEPGANQATTAAGIPS